MPPVHGRSTGGSQNFPTHPQQTIERTRQVGHEPTNAQRPYQDFTNIQPLSSYASQPQTTSYARKFKRRVPTELFEASDPPEKSSDPGKYVPQQTGSKGPILPRRPSEQISTQSSVPKELSAAKSPPKKSLHPSEYVPERSISDISELGPLTPAKSRETTIWTSPLTPRSPLPPIPRSPRVPRTSPEPRTSPDPRIYPEPRTSPEHYTYPEVYTHSGAYTPEHTPVEPFIPPLQGAECSELTELRKTKSEETDDTTFR